MPKHLFEDDTWLEPKLREANPFPAPADHDLDERALADLSMILAEGTICETVPGAMADEVRVVEFSKDQEAGNVIPLMSSKKIARRWVIGAVAAVAAGVLIAVPLGSSPNGPGKAVASPLALTSIKPATISTRSAIDQLIDTVKANPDGADFNTEHIDLEHWEANSMFIPLDEKYLDIDLSTLSPEESDQGIDGESDSRISIPVKNEIRRNSDGSGTIKQIVGEPFSITGEDVKFVSFEGNSKPGTEATHVFKPAEFFMMHPKTPPNSAKKFYDLVYGGLRPDAAEVYDGPQGYFQTIGFMMTEWNLDQEQTIALLGTIPMIQKISYMGSTTDRWNREAMAFGVDTRREGDNGGIYRTMLLFNPETGRLSNYVEEYRPDRNSKDKPDFDVDTVVRYIAVAG